MATFCSAKDEVHCSLNLLQGIHFVVFYVVAGFIEFLIRHVGQDALELRGGEFTIASLFGPQQGVLHVLLGRHQNWSLLFLLGLRHRIKEERGQIIIKTPGHNTPTAIFTSDRFYQESITDSND